MKTICNCELDQLELEFYADKLIDYEYVEDVCEFNEADAKALLDLISEKTGKQHILIIHENVGKTEIIYDLALDDSDVNKILREQWSLD